MRLQQTERSRRAGMKNMALLGMMLAVGIFATGKEPAGQHSGQHSGSATSANPTDPMAPGTTQPPTMIPSADLPGVNMDPGVRAHMDAERLKAANDDRHKRLEADVDKLISLTNELKTDVDKTNKDELSLDVIRKANEIEKLAHDVQSRMKN
ncbi:MAG TPA: hypothetical protein VMD97_11560 [Candidatus Aquilonibacter sp.]|nr:hypothetical protein [Candidatus Aquilonibacter sp.]